MPSAIERVQESKVTTENPPRDDIDGLNYQRCAALHNAIVEHGWTRSGRVLDAMLKTTWWDMQNDRPERDATISLLHHSVVEFLKLAYQFNEDNFYYFHYLPDSRGAGDLSMSFKEDLDDPDYEDRFYTLYCTDETHTSNPDGLIYDQEMHTCLLALNTHDLSQDKDNSWQKLESVLTVYIDLIETGKVVAVHRDLEFPDDVAWYDAPDPALSGLRFARDRPGAMLVDPVSGHAKKKGIVDPWMCVSSTETDLSDTLRVWEMLVEAIHDRTGGQRPRFRARVWTG